MPQREKSASHVRQQVICRTPVFDFWQRQGQKEGAILTGLGAWRGGYTRSVRKPRTHRTTPWAVQSRRGGR